MRLGHWSIRLAFAAFAATLCLYGAQKDPEFEADETPVILPKDGSMDERPFFSSRRHPAIMYDRPSTDLVDALARKVDEGSMRLNFDKTNGYLTSILEALRVPVESQSVVFSKTSLQAHYISPSNPRAIFFTDEVAVAFIRDAPLLEILALNPKQGVVFYALSQQAGRPQIVRSDSCLSCHETRNSMGIPGLLARSMGVGEGGQTKPQLGTFNSDHRSPFEERWGGWFITGKTGAARHMGNTMLGADSQSSRPSGAPKALASLADRFDPTGYPSRFSDVGAVMVLNHQVGMMNRLIRLGWETRIALDQQSKHREDKVAAERLIDADARELADYMLFADEPALPGKFESTSGFQTNFAAGAPQDRKGRSLKQLDLEKRLMRYPCSYMIYSPAFDGLPNAAKDAVYARLWAVLSGQDKAPKYAKLSAADRAAIVGILIETKPGLPEYFRPLSQL